MKTPAISTIVLLAALTLLAPALLSAAPAAPAPFGYVIDKVDRADNAEIVRGTSLMTVLRLMGPAAQKLSPDVWVYQNHPVADAAAAARGCNLLVVTFANGKVTDLKIVNDRATVAIAENLKRQANAPQIAQK